MMCRTTSSNGIVTGASAAVGAHSARLAALGIVGMAKRSAAANSRNGRSFRVIAASGFEIGQTDPKKLEAINATRVSWVSK
jgi:hypothetical protein